MREKRWLLTVAVVLCYAIQLCALPSKDKTVTLNLNGVSIENFLDAVKKQTGANMLYSADMFKGTRSVTVKANGEKWESVLKRVLTEHGFDYVIKDGIVVMRKLQHSTENGAHKIRGTVVDQKGDAIPGANIYVVGNSTMGLYRYGRYIQHICSGREKPVASFLHRYEDANSTPQQSKTIL